MEDVGSTTAACRGDQWRAAILSFNDSLTQSQLPSGRALVCIKALEPYAEQVD